MQTQTAETTTETLQYMLRCISELSAPSIKRLAEYVEELIEEQEEAEDIAAIDARADEPTVPFEEIIKDYEAQHGPFHRV